MLFYHPSKIISARVKRPGELWAEKWWFQIPFQELPVDRNLPEGELPPDPDWQGPVQGWGHCQVQDPRPRSQPQADSGQTGRWDLGGEPKKRQDSTVEKSGKIVDKVTDQKMMFLISALDSWAAATRVQTLGGAGARRLENSVHSGPSVRQSHLQSGWVCAA